MAAPARFLRLAPIFRRLWLATRSLIVAAVCTFICIAATFPGDRLVNFEHFEDKFGPPKDYLPTEQKFIDNGDYSSAMVLGDFVRENQDLPHASEIIALRDRAEADYNSWLARSRRVASGFLTGNTDSSQGMAGDVAANFLVYGNVRDLARESYHEVRGEPVDRLVVALSAGGLAADIATYFPATTEGGAPAETGFSLLKALERAGALTADFADKILGLAKGARSVEKMKELATCALGTVKIYHFVPDGTVGYVMKTVRSTDDLATVTKAAQEAPKEVALIAKFDEAGGIEAMRSESATKQTLDEYLKFGRRVTVRLITPTHVLVGLMKTLWAVKLSYFLHNFLPNDWRVILAWVTGFAAVFALGNAFRHSRAMVFVARHMVDDNKILAVKPIEIKLAASPNMKRE